jgi:O-antigen/teichoic acid export membrane protein
MQINKKYLLIFSKVLSGVGSLYVNYLGILYLDSKEYGNILLVVSLINIVILLSEFSIFSSMSRIIIDKYHTCIANSIICLFIVAVLNLLFFKILILFSKNFISTEVYNFLNHIEYISWIMVIPLWFEQILKSLGNSKIIALNLILTKIIILLLLILFKDSITSKLFLDILIIIPGVISFLLFLYLKPEFYDIKKYFITLLLEIKNFGIKFYLPKQLNLIIFQTDKPLLFYFIGASSVTFYTIAMSFGSVLMMISVSISQDRFKKLFKLNLNSDKEFVLDNTHIFYTFMISIATGFLLSKFLYTSISNELYPIIIPALLAVYFQSKYQIYNSWLLVNGKSQELSFLLWRVMIINILGNILFIPFFGAAGACIASLFGNFSYFYLSRKCVVNADNF